jgi:hypothetical protein
MGREPNHYNGIYGAARAAELSGDLSKAKTYYVKLVTLCDKADTQRPELQHARSYLRPSGWAGALSSGPSGDSRGIPREDGAWADSGSWTSRAASEKGSHQR